MRQLKFKITRQLKINRAEKKVSLAIMVYEPI